MREYLTDHRVYADGIEAFAENGTIFSTGLFPITNDYDECADTPENREKIAAQISELLQEWKLDKWKMEQAYQCSSKNYVENDTTHKPAYDDDDEKSYIQQIDGEWYAYSASNKKYQCYSIGRDSPESDNGRSRWSAKWTDWGIKYVASPSSSRNAAYQKAIRFCKNCDFQYGGEIK